MIKILIALLTLISSFAPASEATYYRFWQGQQRSDLSQNQFLDALGSFMTSTSRIYTGRGLNNYLVAVPPLNKPSFIPDEFALVAFESQASYDFVRQTPEGKAYGDSHWALFDRSRSKSALMKSSGKLEPSVAFDVLGKPVDWASSYVTIFIGTRKTSIAPDEFIAKIEAHVRNAAQKLAPKGLRGYVMLATNDYEIAYLAYPSKEANDAALATSDGATVVSEASSLMDILMFSTSEPFKGIAQPGHFYSTVKLP